MKMTRYLSPMWLGLFFLSFLFIPVLLTSVIFLGGGNIHNGTIFYLSVLLSIGTVYAFCKDKKTALAVSVVGIIAILFIMGACGLCFEWWYDGNTYHKGIAGLLANGWNPLKCTYYEYAKDYNFLKNATLPWYDSYPKGTEIFIAVLYAATGNIETGKAFNAISIAATYLLWYSFLGEVGRLRTSDRLIIAALIAVNPIMLSQASTAYCDGFLYELLFLFIAAMVYLTFRRGGKYTAIAYYIILVTIGLGLNAKSSGLIFFGSIGILMFLYWTYKTARGIMPAKALWTNFSVLSISVIIALAVIGSNTYIINIIRHHNPLYPLVGENSFDIMTNHLGQYIKNKPYIVQVIVSLFSKTGDKNMADTLNLKVPFTFDITQLRFGMFPDTRIGGWGVFFSGIFLLSVGVIIYGSVKLWNTHREMIVISILFGCLIFAEACTVTSLYWARYFLILFLIPAYAVFVAALYVRGGKNTGKDTGKKAVSIVAALITVLCVANALPSGLKSIQQITHYPAIKAEIEELKEIQETEDVVFKESPWFGRFYNLIDHGVSEFTFDAEDLPDSEYQQIFTWGYQLFYRVKE